MKTMALIALLTCAWLVAAGCGGSGGTKTIDVGDGNRVSLGDTLPDSFPSDFPIYNGADLQGAVEGEQEGVRGTVATWSTGDAFDKVKAFYDDAFGSGKWTSTAKGSGGGSSFWTVENSSTGKVGYIAINEGDPVTIIGTVGDNPSASNASSSSGSSGGSDGSDDASDTPDASDSSNDGSTGDASSSTLPPEVALPADFPKSTVSLPGDARVTAANTISVGGAQTFSINFYTKQSIEELGRFFKSALEGKGYTQSVQTNDASGIYAAYSENSDGSGTVVVLSASDSDVTGYRQASLQVSER